jgi:predicted secreted protein
LEIIQIHMSGRGVAIFFIIIGIVLIIQGLTSAQLINESEISATDEERPRAKATPLRRLVVVSAGVAAIVVGIYQLVHSGWN